MDIFYSFRVWNQTKKSGRHCELFKEIRTMSANLALCLCARLRGIHREHLIE